MHVGEKEVVPVLTIPVLVIKKGNYCKLLNNVGHSVDAVISVVLSEMANIYLFKEERRMTPKTFLYS